MNRPRVTIGIPTYNRVDLLRRALESALSQTRSDIEVVVSDDGSSDGTRDFLATVTDERVRFFSQPENRGMFTNMNTCLKLARGSHFLMLSDDDFLEPGCVQALLQPWESSPDLAMSYGQWWYHRANGKELQASSGPEREDGWSYVRNYWEGRRPTILHGTLFRSADLIRLGGIPAGYAQDTMLTLRAAFEGRVAHVAQPVTHYCLQPGSATHKISLARLIEDIESLVRMCVAVGAEKGISSHELRELTHVVQRNLSKDAAFGIVSLVGKGHSRARALEEAYRLRKHLLRRAGLGATAVAAAAILPRSTINSLRRARRLRAGLPLDVE